MDSAALMPNLDVHASPRRVSILGATGSVGGSTLDLIARNPQTYEVVALTANTNAVGLAKLAIEHNAALAVVADESCYADLKDALVGSGIEAAAGSGALVEAAGRPADWIMAAISGAAGLRSTFEAARQGTHLAFANKECLVSAGDVFMQTVAAAQTSLLPVDSEHSAAFQAIDSSPSESIERIVLTASGGPFRTWSHEKLERATLADALKHPNWTMGQKITVDSATMMNKGLELIEAYHLFPVERDQLDVLIHPQSIIHCLVEYSDGSVLAQMSSPDMRTPIAYSLAWPRRMWAPTERLDLAKLGELTFEAPDETRFKALRIAREALAKGGSASTVLNAANEVFVAAFLKEEIGFLSISDGVEATMEQAERGFGGQAAATLDDVLEIDKEARALAARQLELVA
jgi:1-deoxy-D-xylulose-5-phosphate reductoisomerase